MPPGDTTGSAAPSNMSRRIFAAHRLISDSFGAEDSSGDTLAQHDPTKTLEVQVNRILREQKLKLGKMKKDNASLRALLESESSSKAEPLPGMSVMVPRQNIADFLF